MNFDQADELNEAIRTIGLRHRALAIAALAPLGIHPGHKVLLLELESEGPRTQAQLASATGYEPPTITMSVRQLEAAGLVLRRPSPTDGRATIVELTDKGRALLPRLRSAWHAVAEQTVGGLASTPFEHLTDVLIDLACSLAASDAPTSDVPRFSGRSHTDETRPKQSKGSPKRPFAG
ncbi:MAG: winged helix-turn-helix transcriptional regulator [Chloroflexi bacterium]|nr:MAG: winged helix-turn-helix transcriptional regulator [Chloroflexota bacterium]